MNNKKTILEKLKIVERVEDKAQYDRASEKQRAEAENREPAEDFKVNKLLSIVEIYNKTGLDVDGTGTVFIIDNFYKALPENLPAEVKRQSVLNLISASSMKLDEILADGRERLGALGNFIQNFSCKTDEIISKNENEIKVLSEKINEHKRVIAERKKLKQEQTSIVQYETQKIQNIIQSVNNTL